MADLLASTKDGNTKEEEISSVADEEGKTSPDHATVEIPVESEGPRRRVLHRVPQHVRERNKQIYEPLGVSLGPYHHGQPHLRRFENFKDEVLNIILKSDCGGARDKGSVFRSKVLKGVDKIRSFYVGLSTQEYDDEALVKMMLRDAGLFLYFVEMAMSNKNINAHCNQSIGYFGRSSMETDFYKWENQIPWWVIKLLISLRYDDDNEGVVVRKFLSYLTTLDYDGLKRLRWEEGTEEEPLHFLEALRVAGLKEEKINGNNDKINGNNENPDKGGQRSSSCPTFKFKWWKNRRCRSSQRRMTELQKSPFRSATELKAKGVRFRPSSMFVTDIRFSSHPFYGLLHFPVLLANSEMTTYYSNVIALELSPGSKSITVTSYINFMKSLIQKPEDVKLLQENGIISSVLEDNEHIVKMINEIDTHGTDDYDIFDETKNKIDKHCNSYSKTWMAELLHTNFRTPWTAVAFFAATFLLCLTFLQTYYTMNPRS